MKLFGVRWRFYGAAQPRHGWKTAGLLFCVFTLAALSAVLWNRSIENSTAFWAANGVLAAGLLLLPRWMGVGFATACIALNAAMNVVGGLPIDLNIAFTTLNLAFSIVVAGLVRTFCGAGMDLGRLRRFLPFVGLVVASAIIEGLIGSLMIKHDVITFLSGWGRWVASDATGVVLALPATLMLFRRENPLYAGRAAALERALLIGGLGAATYAAFSISGSTAFLFLYPAVLFAAFRLGSAWAFVGAWVVAQAATVQTIAGKGPIALFDGSPPFRDLMLLQIFLASLLLTASLATSALAERVRSEQRLRRREAAAAAARARADQMVATRQRFLAVVSHEIRTPLNGIMGFTQALAGRPGLDDESRRQVAQISRSSEVLMTIVEDILDFSRLEANRFELDPTPTRIADVVEQAAAAAQLGAAAKGLGFSLDAPDLGTDLHGVDARRLRQVLQTFTDNAIKFTSEGSIGLRVARDGDCFSFHVLDTGVGVPPERRGELFQPFAQLDPTLTRQHAGTGLGLAICRSLSELMGGETGYAPRAEGGSDFWMTVTLPNAGEATTEADAVPDGLDRAPRVLIVDDHPVNREVARLILTACGCDVAECEDGAEAVEAARTTPFDIILMDVRMPGMDGLEATRAIRRLAGPAALTPIIAVTADVMRDDIERCREAGMNGHVPKPINQDRLLDALNRGLAGVDGFPAAASQAA